MPILPHATVIGLTGPFGSGCTTAAFILRDRMQYHYYRMSAHLCDEWAREHPALPSRKDLQHLGDQLRTHHEDPGLLANVALGRLEASTAETERVVCDGIRNTGEIQVLRDRFGPGFHLFGIECRTSDRWERLTHLYADEQEFGTDDDRD